MFEPGTVTAYSNYGATLAAYIVERISGQPFGDYVKENILDRLGMRDTSVRADLSDNPSVEERRLLNWGDDLEGDRLTCAQMIYVNFFPAGSTVGTMADFYRFADALLPGRTELFASADTLNTLYTPTAYYADSGVPSISHGFLWNQFGVNVLGHGGNTANQSSMLMFDPVSSVGMAVMTNQAHEQAYNYGMYDLVFGSFQENPLYDESKAIPAGLITMSRSTFRGPLQLMSSTMPLSYSEEDRNAWWYEKDGTIYGGLADGWINTGVVVFNLILTALTLLAGVYVLATCVSGIVHIFMKKGDHPFRKFNYALAAEMAVTTVALVCFIAFNIAVGSSGVFGNGTNFKICSAVYLAMAVAMLITLVFAALRFRSCAANEKKGEKIKYIITAVCMLIMLAFIARFEMYAFWMI